MKRKLLLPILGLGLLLSSCGNTPNNDSSSSSASTTKSESVSTTASSLEKHVAGEYTLEVCDGSSVTNGGIKSGFCGDSTVRMNGKSVDMSYGAYIDNKTDKDMSFTVTDLKLTNIVTGDEFTDFTIANSKITLAKSQKFTVEANDGVSFVLSANFYDENKNGKGLYEYTIGLKNSLNDVYTIKIGKFAEIYKYTNKQDVTLYLDSSITLDNGLKLDVTGEYDNTFAETEDFNMKINITNNTTGTFSIYMDNNREVFSLNGDKLQTEYPNVDFYIDGSREYFHEDEIAGKKVKLDVAKSIEIKERITSYNGKYPFYTYNYFYDTTNKIEYRIKLIYTLTQAN